jgi:hypothetical protein
MTDFNSYKDQVSSEKITLAVMEASKRIIALILHAGSVYKILNFDFSTVRTIQDSGIPLTEVFDLASVIAGTFYNDRTNLVLYLQTSDSVNPNNKFLHMTFKLFFASVPVTLPNDLASGPEVYWEPQIQSTSTFGVEIDTVNQQNETIEGSGSLSLFNDQDFWPANFDKLFFDNQNCYIYSWNRDLAPSEARLIFKGKIESKTYDSKKVSFQLKDLLSQLRNAVSSPEISTLGRRNPPNLDMAKQRLIFGRVFGFRPTNLDASINGKYPITGTVAINVPDTTLVGTGTKFLKELSPNDRLLLNGVEYTIATVTDDTHLELSSTFSGVNITGLATEVFPSVPKRWMNRVWCIASHPLRKPETIIQTGSSTSNIFVGSTKDMFAGDYIYVGDYVAGTGELVNISEVVNATIIRLATSLSTNPVPGIAVFKPSIQQLRINDTTLVFGRDYTIDSATAILTLKETAEVNAAPTREGLETATFTNGSRTVTGVSTFFKSFLKENDIVRPKGTSEWFEILSVDSDVSLTLRTAPIGLTPNPRTSTLQYKTLVFDEGNDVLHCEVIGRTTNNTTSGGLLRKAPEITSQLLYDAGFVAADINAQSFVDSQNLVPEDLGFVIPVKFDDKTLITYRDVINLINKSVFGIIFQDNQFKMTYDVLRPVVPIAPIVIKESDCLSWTCTSTNKNMISRAIVEYGAKEYDYNILQSSIQTVTNSSKLATYILGTSRERVFQSVLVNVSDAQRLCDRWKFLLEFSTNQISIQTKLQLIDAEINNIVDFEHRKFYERFSGTSKRKFLSIEKIKKNGQGVLIECVDLSNAFNRIALITDSLPNWSNSNEEIKIRSGFYSDSSGLINNEENSFQVNLIW